VLSEKREMMVIFKITGWAQNLLTWVPSVAVFKRGFHSSNDTVMPGNAMPFNFVLQV
jgi:hypothetical protein